MLVIIGADMSFVFGVSRVGLVTERAGEAAQSGAGGFGLIKCWYVSCPVMIRNGRAYLWRRICESALK